MNNTFREKEPKNYFTPASIAHFIGAIVILGIAFLMFFGARLGIEMVQRQDETLRYIYGGLCLVYGGFRLYRAFNQQG